MSSWGTRRRNLIITIFLCGVFVLIAITSFNFFYKDPNCFDGKQNQGETGIDCGGPCALLCPHETVAPLVKWNRYFEVVPGIYNAVAYIENQNPHAKTENVNYKFTLFDDKNVILAENYGSVDLRPAEIIPVIADAMNTGRMIPSRMTFEIDREVVWHRAEQRPRLIRLKNEQLFYDNRAPRVSAELENTSHFPVKNIKLIVILYNNEGNAVGVSRTMVEEILSNQIRNVLFTWPQDFSSTVSRFEIFPLYESN